MNANTAIAMGADTFQAKLAVALEDTLATVTKASDGPFHVEGWQQSPAHELWRKATSHKRHDARVQATLSAAYLAADMWGLVLAPIGAAIALLIDILGDGGPLGLGNGTSQRRSPFSRLGSGRRQANDGAAWSAASEEAFTRLLAQASGHEDVWEYSKLIIFYDNECGVSAAQAGVDTDDNGQDSRWDTLPARAEFETLAANALLASVGALPDFAVNSRVEFNLTPDQAKAWYEECSAARKAVADTANLW